MKVKELDLSRVWLRYLRSEAMVSHEGFINHLRDMVTDPQRVKALIKWCPNCGSPVFETTTLTQNGMEREYCQPCVTAYFRQCAECANHTNNWTVVGPTLLCSECLNRDYFYCRPCGQWVTNDEASEHRHGADGCCASPGLEFTFPNNGEWVAQDTRVGVALDTGLNDHGLAMIREEIMRFSRRLGDIYDSTTRARKMYDFGRYFDVGREPKTKEGNYPTRVKRLAYKDYSLKLEPSLLTKIGNIASTNSGDNTFRVEVTRDLNKTAAEFGHQGSCWWSDYNGSRCILKSNGGIGLRSFAANGRVNGRVWVWPMRVDVDGRLTPTFRTDGDIWFVFNPYGVLAEQVGVRVVAQMVGIESYQRTEFRAQEGFYVNNSVGYLVAARPVLDRHTWLNIGLRVHSNLFETEKEMTNV